jgi:hypothetical protein
MRARQRAHLTLNRVQLPLQTQELQTDQTFKRWAPTRRCCHSGTPAGPCECMLLQGVCMGRCCGCGGPAGG